MPVTLVEESLAVGHGDEDETGIGHVVAMFLAAAHAVVISKAAQAENLVPVNRDRGRGI